MTQSPLSRSFLSITGDDRVHFLQGLLTNDISKLNADKIQFAALLSPQGKILHDMFVIAVDNAILLDTQTAYKDTLLKRLHLYKLRAKVAIEEITNPESLIPNPLPDPRHPALPTRNYSNPQSLIPNPQSPIPELGRDFFPDELTALDAGYDLLHAISFTKGCYVGQEVTARMHYKSIARKGWFWLETTTTPPHLALLKFEDIYGSPQSRTVMVDGTPTRATLPDWMAPKLAQFQASIPHP